MSDEQRCTAVVAGTDEVCGGPVEESVGISLCDYHLVLAWEQVQKQGGPDVLIDRFKAIASDPWNKSWSFRLWRARLEDGDL